MLPVSGLSISLEAIKIMKVIISFFPRMSNNFMKRRVMNPHGFKPKKGCQRHRQGGFKKNRMMVRSWTKQMKNSRIRKEG